LIPASRAAWFVLGAGLAATPGQIRPIAAHDLRVSLAEIDSNGVRLLRLRTFMDTSGSPWMLAVDPFSLEPSLHRRFGWMETGRPLEVLDSTPWGRLRRVELDFGWRTAGLSRILGRDRGIVLSVDLCPSRKPLDRRIVRRVWDSFRHDDKPVPVSFSLSGTWIRNHADDLAWLESQVDSGRIDPTWINHTDHHRYIRGVPDHRNFLFLPGTDVLAEILGAEREMLRHGAIPSVFFRFPGLMDDSAIFGRVVATGLLPVGSDAWLAKRQAARPGSIVLIHGNGNEPVGVDDFLRLLDSERMNIRQGSWHLEDLSEDLEEEEAPPKGTDSAR
jgi:peptidoglycan/xylan/chitin deacetylase (PgdA/CDA1 family)